MRKLHLWDSGPIDAAPGFLRDQAAAAEAAEQGSAALAVWTRPNPSVAFGRFHRLPQTGACERRLSGGRAVPLGQGIVGFSLVCPQVGWLDPRAPALRPDQVLNRALRPLLDALRGFGVDAFYPGRDIITAAGLPIAHASFTVLTDGVCVCEMQVAATRGFDCFADLLGKADPHGVAAVDRDQFAGATAAGLPDAPQVWVEAIAAAVPAAFDCEVIQENPVAGASAAERVEGAPAYDAFLRERVAVPAGHAAAAAVSMLGAVEASARIANGCLHDVEVCGDLIAPFHTLEAISQACEGAPLKGPTLRRRLAGVLTQPRNFLLGFQELDDLLLRLMP